MTCISLPSFLLSRQTFSCLYIVLSVCAFPAVCSSYAEKQDKYIYELNTWERLGCSIVAASWPVLIAIRALLLGVQFFHWVLPY
jgi:hypothetical protein